MGPCLRMGSHVAGRNIRMKKLFIFIICLGILAPGTIALSQSTLKIDYAEKLSQCLITKSYEQYHLMAITDKDKIMTYAMNKCYGIHFQHVNSFSPNMNIALDMMHNEKVINAYEEMAEAALDYVIRGGKPK